MNKTVNHFTDCHCKFSCSQFYYACFVVYGHLLLFLLITPRSHRNCSLNFYLHLKAKTGSQTGFSLCNITDWLHPHSQISSWSQDGNKTHISRWNLQVSHFLINTLYVLRHVSDTLKHEFILIMDVINNCMSSRNISEFLFHFCHRNRSVCVCVQCRDTWLFTDVKCFQFMIFSWTCWSRNMMQNICTSSALKLDFMFNTLYYIYFNHYNNWVQSVQSFSSN